MIIRAAAALPDDDPRRALDELRTQLATMAGAVDATPDWTTLTLAGPVEMPEADAGARFEWTATVVVGRKDEAAAVGEMTGPMPAVELPHPTEPAPASWVAGVGPPC